MIRPPPRSPLFPSPPLSHPREGTGAGAPAPPPPPPSRSSEPAEYELHRLFGERRPRYVLDRLARLQDHDRAAETQREADLRERAPAAADRDHRVTGSDHREVARMSDPCGDGMVDPLVRLLAPLARENPDRRPACRLRAARRGRHHPAEPASDDRAAALSEQASDLLGAPLVLTPAADYRDLNRRHAAIVEPC